MYSFLKGLVVSKHPNSPFGTYLVIDVNGVGYNIVVSAKTLDKISKEGCQVTIYTQLIHREDTMYLCGFLTPQERDIFNFLQSVSGVGVKVALKLIADHDPINLISYVVKQDFKSLGKTKGIGPKIAQRIVLELKDKMLNWRPELERNTALTSSSEELQSYVEAESVMYSLGYDYDDIKIALEKAFESVVDKNNTEEVLHFALSWLSKN